MKNDGGPAFPQLEPEAWRLCRQPSAAVLCLVVGFVVGLSMADRMWKPLHREAFDGWQRNVWARVRERYDKISIWYNSPSKKD